VRGALRRRRPRTAERKRGPVPSAQAVPHYQGCTWRLGHEITIGWAANEPLTHVHVREGVKAQAQRVLNGAVGAGGQLAALRPGAPEPSGMIVRKTVTPAPRRGAASPFLAQNSADSAGLT
jgi:hypothetical protein